MTDDTKQLLQRGFRYATSLVGSNGEAEDILHDAFVGALNANAQLTFSYLAKAIRSKIYDRNRKNRVIPFPTTKHDEMIDQGEDMTTLLHERWTMEQAFETLRVFEREVLYLSVVEGYTTEEIANLTERPKGTVCTTLHRTKKKLMEQLSNKEREAIA